MSAPNSLTYVERETYRREVLNIPSPLDEWLLSNERSPRIAFLKVYLMLGDVEAEYVTCRVDMEHDLIAGIETYRLYIVAKPSPRSLHSPERQLSPRAMLAFFAGGKDDIAAPPWTQWTKTTSIFQQPVGTFATLFARMATWPLNLAQRNLSARMIMWSRIFVILPQTYALVTPERPHRPVENTRTHKPRARPQAQPVQTSPIAQMKQEMSDD
ncbi:hypothetical protein FIBSPDRAFT_901516 [Athelia psychrophila]|uniref:Uncharacterized protein n=1 Tax=Athelia psychrophila TaxID=1759441 RepID=A0A165X2R9_9AGAM|nr:hypothetical protein FIBSPDRAFT_901516 [Fibularhizoctonia sp. CBS 109695]